MTRGRGLIMLDYGEAMIAALALANRVEEAERLQARHPDMAASLEPSLSSDRALLARIQRKFREKDMQFASLLAETKRVQACAGQIEGSR